MVALRPLNCLMEETSDFDVPSPWLDEIALRRSVKGWRPLSLPDDKRLFLELALLGESNS